MAKREMVESKGVEMFRFTREGEELSGHLLKMGKVQILDKESGEEKQVVQGILRQNDGQVITFLMTYDIQRKLWAKHVGRYITLRYETTKKIDGQKNPMGVFKVTHSTEVEMNPDLCAAAMEDAGLYAVTSEDIPF